MSAYSTMSVLRDQSSAESSISGLTSVRLCPLTSTIQEIQDQVARTASNVQRARNIKHLRWKFQYDGVERWKAWAKWSVDLDDQVYWAGCCNPGFDMLSRHISPSAFYNAGHDFDYPKCHPKTRGAVLNRLTDWILARAGPSPPIMWLYGAAGSGKSCIARSIAEWCEKRNILLASFFFLRSDATRNTARRLIPTIAYNITQTSSTSRSSILLAIESDPHIFSKTMGVQFSRLVLEPLSLVQVAHDSPYVLIIDGLDECLQEAEQKAILRLLGQYRSWGMKILVASRPEQAIRSSFDDIPLQGLHTCIALSNEYEAYEDIRRFLADKFAEIKRTHRSKAFIPAGWPSVEDIERLVWRSSGQFIYAATVVKYISSDRHSPVTGLRSILGNLSPPIGRRDLPFAELDAVYAHILHTAGERVDSLETVLRVVAFTVISISSRFWILHREIYASPVAMLADILTRDVETVSCILTDLSSIISCSDSGLGAYHASLGDFLFDRTRSGQLWVDLPLFLSDIACRCLSMLPTLSKKSCIIWSMLSDAIMRCRPTPAVSRSLLSFDFIGSLNILSPLMTTESDFLHSIDLLHALCFRAVTISDWEGPSVHLRLMSIFDHWIAGKFRNCCQNSPIMKAQVATLCCRWDAKAWEWRLYDLKLCSKRYPLESPDIFCRGHGILDGRWFALLDKNYLPSAAACILDPDMLASGVLLCTHVLLQNTMTGFVMRFVADKKQKLLPWIWRKRTHRQRNERRGRIFHVDRLPFRELIHIAQHLSFPWKEEEQWIHTISSVLEALPQLLGHRPAHAQVVTPLRLVLSLQSTNVRHAPLLHNAKHAITQYLRHVVGLKCRRGTRLSFVNVVGI